MSNIKDKTIAALNIIVVWGFAVGIGGFSLMHGLGPNVNGFSVLNLFLISIVFFQLTRVCGNLWAAIGFHVSWNFVMGGVLGVSVSGMKPTGSIFASEYTTGNYINGINGGWHGLEGSFICTILMAVVIWGIWFVFTKRGRVNDLFAATPQSATELS